MTKKNTTYGIILPLVIMSFCLLCTIISDETLSFFFNLTHLLIIFAYICTMAVIAKKRKYTTVFKYTYWTIAIPFVLGLLFVFMSHLQDMENTFFRSVDFDNLVFIFFLGGFVSAVDVVGTVRLFYNPYSPNLVYDVLFVSVITAILLITPILIYKFTKLQETKTDSH